jgi:hypothetical protein
MPCNDECPLCQDETPIIFEGAPAAPVELEARWLAIVTFLTVAWLLIGGAGFGLTYAFTGSAWSAAWALPALIFGAVTVAQVGRVYRAVQSGPVRAVVIRRAPNG